VTRVNYLIRLAGWYDGLFSGYDGSNYEAWLAQQPPGSTWGAAGRLLVS
jgi:hypothetical protein